VFSEIYGNSTIRGLTVGSRQFFASPPAGFSDYPLWKQRRSVMIGRNDQLAKLKGAHDEWVKLVPSVRWLEGDEARGVTPMLKHDYVAGGVLEPAANDLDVHEIHRGFLRGAARTGTSLVCDAEILELSRQGAAWRVRTKSGEFSGSFLINAAGAWGDTIAALAGARPVGLAPKRRTAILFDPAPPEDVNGWPIIIDADEQFYFKPDAGRLLGSPADETVSPPCDAQPEEIDVAVAVDRIEQAATFRVQRLVRKWAGLRTFVADKSPVVGFDREVPGFFWLVGQGGYGIQTSPAMGRVTAALIGGGEIPDDLQRLGVRAANLSPARLR
jgi:D-arginine dehydrogenase